jgi:glutamate racemase
MKVEADSMLDAAREALHRLDGKTRPIVLMDSGVGGLPYLEAARLVLQGERYAYLADRAGFPYGTKSRGEIESLVLDRLARLVSAFDPKAIVIACNTASQAALAAARLRFPGIPIVGTVPAVKPAAERSRSGVIGVMATEHALVDPYLDELIMSHAPGARVLREPAQGLVAFVEHELLAASAEARREAVLPHVRRLIDAGADEIVLACTHFLHVAEDIRSAAQALSAEAGAKGKPVEVIDSRDGVARRLREVLAGMGLLALPEAAGRAGPRGGQQTGEREDGVFLLSGPPPFEEAYTGFARRFGLLGPFSLEGKR